MASVKQRKRKLQRIIRRLKNCERRLIKREKQQHMWMRRLRRQKIKIIQKQKVIDRRKKTLSRRETAKLNRTLRRRRRK